MEIHEAYLTKVAHFASFCSWRESGLLLIDYAVRTNQGLSLDNFGLGEGCHFEADCAAVVGVGRGDDVVVDGRRGGQRPMTTDTVSCCAKMFSRASASLVTTTQPKSNDK
jgi:hypothetical protein